MAKEVKFKSEYIHSLIGIVLMFIGFFIPPFATLTDVGVRVLFIFIGQVYLWSTVGSIWPSLLGLVFLGMSGFYTSMSAALQNGFGNNTVILILFSMILFGGLVECGVANYISRFFLTRKICNGRPYLFMFIFMYGIFILSTLTNTFATIVLSWSIVYTILTDLGYSKDDKFSKFFVFASFVAAILGQSSIPFRGSEVALYVAFENTFGVGINNLMYMILAFTMAAFLIAGLCIMCKLVYRCDVSKLKQLDVEEMDKRDPLPPLNNSQKFYFVVCMLFILMLLIPTVLDKSIPVVAFLNSLNNYGITIVFVAVCCILRIDGKPVLNFKAVASKHVDWGVILLVAVALMLSSALTSDATGIKPIIIGILNPLLGERSIWATGCILVIFSFVLTNFANNFVCGSVMMPIWGAFALEMGISSAAAPAIASITILCLYLAFVTPAASPLAAMLYGNREWLTPGDVLKMAIPFSLYVLFIYCTVGYLLANLLFGLIV